MIQIFTFPQADLGWELARSLDFSFSSSSARPQVLGENQELVSEMCHHPGAPSPWQSANVL